MAELPYAGNDLLSGNRHKYLNTNKKAYPE